MIFGIVFISIVVIAFVMTFYEEIHDFIIIRREDKRLKVEPKVKMSVPAKQLIKEFNLIPENHRPAYDINKAVEALDVKHGISEVDAHWYVGPYRPFDWRDCPCTPSRYDKCRGKDYRDLHEEITMLRRAAQQQEHAIAILGAEEGLHEASNLLNALREERKLINSVTTELKGPRKK